jgi:gliding motility-associated lipoprotein GldH
MTRKIVLSALAFVLLLTACNNSNECYHHAEVISPKGWDQNQTLYFQDSLASDAPETLCFEIDLRHTNLFPYQNIWLYIRTKSSDNTNRLDSINWSLAEPSGRWIGSGWGSLYTLTHRLPDLTIHQTIGKRWFSIEIQHGLKDQTLNGIEDVGVHLFHETAKK